ncbi:MAG: beta-ketoacyl-ACP synthase II [Verrucomicrobiales bacterium]|nr:beta-ketoacyl-ACP synthase II [Verrucomicrobiales bacterium]MED5585823.1 beta-ketoacyl-ACP synthase II [Verrucomicrobiota bacterium]
MSERRVAITGIGVLSPVGNDLEQFWQSLVEGKSGIDRITNMDATDFVCRIGGEIKDFDPKIFYKNPKDARRTDRYGQLAMAAAKMAYEDSGMEECGFDPFRFGCMIGSGIGGLMTLEKQHGVYLNKGPGRVSPFTIPMMIGNIASGLISMEYGLCGPNMSIVTACATANNNIGEAWRMIKFGDADIFLAGGAEASISAMGLAGFASMKALSLRNDEPARASRPFDKDRDGFVMGEGAGVVVIEELEHARARGAEIYCELAGYGVSADAHHMTSPHPEGVGASRCMDMAMQHAGVNPSDVDYVNAHGTSTFLGDICETKAIKDSFGDHASNGLLVSSTKSMTGHLLGAAGGVELAACVQAIRTGIVPPTINLEQPDEQCDLDYVANHSRHKDVKVALSNSFGFGGHNATLIVKAVD